MASTQGFLDGSLDYRHTYNVKDLPGKLPLPLVQPGTILEYLLDRQEQSWPFLQYLYKSGYTPLLNNIQGAFTLFLPLQVPCMSDDYEKRKFVEKHLLEYPLVPVYLYKESGSVLNTKNPKERLYLSRGIINGIPVLDFKALGASIVYTIPMSL